MIYWNLYYGIICSNNFLIDKFSHVKRYFCAPLTIVEYNIMSLSLSQLKFDLRNG